MKERSYFAVLCALSLYAALNVMEQFCTVVNDILAYRNDWTGWDRFWLACLAFGPGIITAVTLIWISKIIVWGRK